MSEKRPTLSIIVPAYNEAPGLEHAVVGTLNSLTDLGIDFELLIIDDCSSDETPEIAKRLAAEHSTVQFYRHRENQGIGGAFRTGVSHARHDYVMLIPVDNPLSPDEIGTYLERMPVCDVIVGVRVTRVGYSTLMKLLSFAYNRILIPLLFNIGITDVNWIQAYRRKLFSSGLLEIEFLSIFFFVELLIKAKKNHLIIVEVPSLMQRRLHGKPSSAKFVFIGRTFIDMIRFFVDTNRGKK